MEVVNTMEEMTMKAMDMALLKLMTQRQPAEVLAVPGVRDALIAGWQDEIVAEHAQQAKVEDAYDQYKRLSASLSRRERRSVEAKSAETAPVQPSATNGNGVPIKEVVRYGPAQSALVQAGLTSLNDLSGYSRKRLESLNRVGPGIIKQISGALKEHGLQPLKK
jgi:hypothetical protein